MNTAFKTLLTVLILAFCPYRGICQASQKTDDKIGKTYKCDATVAVEVYDQINKAPVVPVVYFLIKENYKIKIFDKYTVDGKTFYIIKTYGYFYGTDPILQEGTPANPVAITTVQDSDNPGRKTIAIETLAANRMIGSKLVNNGTKIEMIDTKERFGGQDAYLLSKDQAINNTFTLSEEYLIYFTEYHNAGIFDDGFQGIGLSALNIPVKIRTDKDNPDFIANLNIGASANLKWRLHPSKPYFGGLMFGASISGIPFVESDFSGTTSNEDRNSTLLAFTPHASIYFQSNQVQIMLGLGADYLAKQISKTWTYNGERWISFGIGISLIKEEKEETPKLADKGSG